MAVAIARVVKMAATFAISCDADAVTTAFRQSCSPIPGDLLLDAVDICLAKQTDSFRVVMPGMVWQVVDPEFRRRRAALDRLRTARMMGDRRGWDGKSPDSDYVSKKSLDDLLDTVRKTLSAASAEAMARIGKNGGEK